MPNAPVAAAAEDLPEFSRRRILAGATAFAAFAGAMPAEAAHDDAELIALGRSFEAALVASCDHSTDDQEAGRRVCLCADLARQMGPYAPTTVEGLRVKVQALLYFTMDVWGLDDWRLDGAPEPEYPGEELQLSLADDVARLRRVRS